MIEIQTPILTSQSEVNEHQHMWSVYTTNTYFTVFDSYCCIVSLKFSKPPPNPSMSSSVLHVIEKLSHIILIPIICAQTFVGNMWCNTASSQYVLHLLQFSISYCNTI